ncbi:phage tail tape measure protein, lambda family [Shigella flexneri]|nr:phage tail tape measure protein, lambda family [Shigella flexneri]
MTEAHKQLLALQQRISDLDGKKLTADEKSVLARKNELIQALTLLDVKQQELQKQTALNDLRKKTVQLTSQLADKERALREQHNLDIATAGMGISSGSATRHSCASGRNTGNSCNSLRMTVARKALTGRRTTGGLRRC